MAERFAPTVQPNSQFNWRTILLFSAVGVLCAGVTEILLVSGNGPLALVAFILPAPFLLIGVWVASEERFVFLRAGRLLSRGLSSGFLFLLAYPFGLVLFLLTVFSVSTAQSWDFDDHPEISLSPFQAFRNEAAFPLGLFLGAVAGLLVCVTGVYVLVGRWPKRVWGPVVIFPLFLVLLAIRFLDGVASVQLPVVASQIALFMIVGYWISSTTSGESESHS